jgi:hypothetical protein
MQILPGNCKAHTGLHSRILMLIESTWYPSLRQAPSHDCLPRDLKFTKKGKKGMKIINKIVQDLLPAVAWVESEAYSAHSSYGTVHTRCTSSVLSRLFSKVASTLLRNSRTLFPLKKKRTRHVFIKRRPKRRIRWIRIKNEEIFLE